MKRISVSRMGADNSFYGKKHSEATKERMRKNKHVMFGKDNPSYGKKLWNYGLTKETDSRLKRISELKIGKNNPMYGLSGSKSPTFGRKHTKEELLKMKKFHKSKTMMKLHREVAAQMMNDGKFSMKPNKTELELQKIIDDANLPYKYVGDGSFTVGWMNPDFVNVNGKKEVVELFGCYWHGCQKCYPNGGVGGIKNNRQQRVAAFKRYGFNCKVIWEHELNKSNFRDCLIKRLSK